MLVIMLASLLFLREPRFQRSEEIFLRWLIRHSQPAAKAVPITIAEAIEIRSKHLTFVPKVFALLYLNSQAGPMRRRF